MADIKAVQGDANVLYTATLTLKGSGDPVDVSSSTVRLYYRKVGAAATIATVVGTKPNGGADGVVEFVLPDECFEQSGRYEAEIEVTTGAQVLTARKIITFDVRKQVG